MVDNFELIKSILEWRSEDDFYFLQLIKRKKDHEAGTVTGVNNNNRCVRSYFIRNVEYLDFVEEEIKGICDVAGARGCIDLNRRSYRKTAFQTLKKISDQLIQEDYDKVYKAYVSCCGKYSNEKSEKKWILDIDRPLTGDEHAQLKLDLHALQPEGDKLLYIIPSKSGIHYITKPFNLQKFNKLEQWDHIDIHKRNPTNIYIPDL